MFPRWPRCVASVCVGLSELAGCASIRKGRYGVESVAWTGMHALSPEALEVCLATRARDSWTLRLGLSAPSCGEPPFESTAPKLELWSWPWTVWPVFDPAIFDAWNLQLHLAKRRLSTLPGVPELGAGPGVNSLALAAKAALRHAPGTEPRGELSVRLALPSPRGARAARCGTAGPGPQLTAAASSRTAGSPCSSQDEGRRRCAARSS